MSARNFAGQTALVVGVGPGLGASLCRTLSEAGFSVVGVGRTLEADGALAQSIRQDVPGFRAQQLDATDAKAVEALTEEIEHGPAPIRALIYNASGFQMGPFDDVSPAVFEATWRTTCLGAMIVAQACLPLMGERGEGAAIFTGATASLRGGAQFSAFASAKFALRGLVQSLSRAYWPKGVHVAHTVLDGLISEAKDALHPNDIAGAYLELIRQPRSAWTQELDLRPNAEKF